MRRRQWNGLTGGSLALVLLLLVLASATDSDALYCSEEQTPTNVKQLLLNMGICPYPEQSELKNILLAPRT